MKIFKNLEELKPYYNAETNTYDFTNFNLVVFEFDLVVDSDIKACNIIAKNINAFDINALDIKAYDINAWDINAPDINALDIKACNIKACNIDACDIKAGNIDACDIKAGNIDADDISYYAFCIAYRNIKCKSIKGVRENCKHFVLDGEIEVI